MPNTPSQVIRTALTPRVVLAVMILGLAWPLAGCGQSKQEGKMSGLTAVVFNYSDEPIAAIKVDGETLGGPFESARPGDVKGGGRDCCTSLDPHRKELPVIVQPAIGGEYLIQAVVEQPWPKDANTVIVHILPKRKVVIETTLGASIAPRSDLLNARLAELGIKKEVNADEYMLPGRSSYSEYMEVKKQ
ncbi:hypothetical protein [Xanthomonas fragariae]|nr:hypothetical protein [Xanthomonas fragariae]